MRIAYFDCFSGVAGDMTLAALVDAGCPFEVLAELPARLGLADVSVARQAVKRHGLAATHIIVHVPESAKKGHRHLPQILRQIDAAGLPAPVAERASAVFRRLAEAEAAAHGTTLDKVHFHEVGAADAIVDIVGACAALHAMQIERIFCAPIPTGHGTVQCEHGLMPVPAPATANLLRGFPIAASDEPGELCTPTGAALMTTLATTFGPAPELMLEHVGVGAGTREGKTRPNILRVLIGELAGGLTGDADVVTVLECQVDDLPGQVLGYTCGRLLDAGAVDVYVTPIVMKKGRPGHLLTVLASPGAVASLEGVIFAETGTLGIRRSVAARTKLPRRHVTVATAYGDVRVKVAGADDSQAWPEFEDCRAAAETHHVALREVQQAALAAWRARKAGTQEPWERSS